MNSSHVSDPSVLNRLCKIHVLSCWSLKVAFFKHSYEATFLLGQSLLSRQNSILSAI